MFVFDTETTTDTTQRLTFGSYRFLVDGKCLEEGLFYGDDLPERDRNLLAEYAASRPADVHATCRREIPLLSRAEFLEKLYKAVYKGQCLLVGFNLPFDLSRLAVKATRARDRFAGGFSLVLWTYRNQNGESVENHFRPRVCIKHIDNKRALKGFSSRRSPDSEDIVFEEVEGKKTKKGTAFRGHFLDLRTLAFALTDRAYTLRTACEDFGVEHGKEFPAAHGKITNEYIDYNRRDVLATSELAEKLLAEYARHPINLQPTKAYSPASIGKAYLRGMGIEPVLTRQPDFPGNYLGFAQTAFYGGRTSAHIRKVPVPVVYTDFLSMYPTVNSLMGLWQFVIAREISVKENCKNEIASFLQTLTAADLFDAAAWGQMTGFVKIVPNGDILPSRGKYNVETNDYQVAVNYLYAADADAANGMWWSLPDVVASVIETGRIPHIVDAFRIVPRGTADGLKPTALRGVVSIDPQLQDFFKVVIEERKHLASRTDLSKIEKSRLDKALKVLANAASYGIYAEMNRRESEEKITVKCYGIDSESYSCRVSHADVPGEFCFPPLPSLITGGARLMLALLEHCVTELGGTYAMDDTDSMAIVATRDGGLIPCEGGPQRSRGGLASVKALAFEDVRKISDRFKTLNPYRRDSVPGSILKIEDDNFDPKTGKQRQLHCLAISAKRYALFLLDDRGEPFLLRADVNNKTDRWSEHGLGHLLNPTNPDDDRDWIGQAWLQMIRKSVGLGTECLGFEEMPAVGRLSISSPAALKPLEQLNETKAYPAQIKPFNFLLSCHVRPFGHPTGVSPERFHLVKPYEALAKLWLEKEWIDQYSGKRYRVTTAGQHGGQHSARIKTVGETLTDYEFHSEPKCADHTGAAGTKATIGLLQRRHVTIEFVKYMGKESNNLEEVDAGTVHCAKNIYTEYADPKRNEWEAKYLPILRSIPLKVLVKECRDQLRRRAIINLRAARSKPHRRNREFLIHIFQKLKLL
jgi:hypothetical protein